MSGVAQITQSAICKGGPFSSKLLAHHGKVFGIWFLYGRPCGGNPDATTRTGSMDGITRGQYRLVGDFWFWEAAK